MRNLRLADHNPCMRDARGNCSLRPFRQSNSSYDRNRAAVEYNKPEWAEPVSGVEAAPTTVIRKIEDVLEMWANSIGKSGHKKFSRKNMIQFAMRWAEIRLLALSPETPAAPTKPMREYLNMAHQHLRNYFLLGHTTGKRDEVGAAISIISEAIRAPETPAMPTQSECAVSAAKPINDRTLTVLMSTQKCGPLRGLSRDAQGGEIDAATFAEVVVLPDNTESARFMACCGLMADTTRAHGDGVLNVMPRTTARAGCAI